MARLLQHLLAESTRRFPDNLAVVSGAEALTYAELDDLSSRLAAVLSKNGVRAGDRIAVYIDKSVASVVSIHGILKAGACYVPIDPTSPPARVAYIIGNCGVRCVVSVAKKLPPLLVALGTSAALEVVVLADDSLPDLSGVRSVRWGDVAAAEPDVPVTATKPDDLAYILYTSGSTGDPKGVMISHESALTFVDWASETIGVSEKDRFSSHAPFHFDLSVFDVFAALGAGATLVLVPPALSVFPYRLAEWIEEQRISVWYSVPSILSMLVRHGDLARFSYGALRTIIFAGEVFPTKFLRELMGLIPHADYYNWYGPTETNVITSYKVPPLEADHHEPIPIGRACKGYEVMLIADDGTRIGGAGDVGEICAAGACVAHGYWGDPEKSALRFTSHPLDKGSKARCYRTGDLARLDETGNLIFLGRRDDQVKSRGYRIELGEIETALYGHPRVKEAAVVAVPDEEVGSRIRAYVALQDDEGADAAVLQKFCQERIPKYMVPESIEFRKTLPKTSTGKVDKQSLLAELRGSNQ